MGPRAYPSVEEGCLRGGLRARLSLVEAGKYPPLLPAIEYDLINSAYGYGHHSQREALVSKHLFVPTPYS